jgi:CheY-like chemotaxis protein
MFILLCDDEPIVLEGLRRLFSRAGALVYAAESMTGFEAILADDSRIPDLIVTDIRLRDSATGKDVAGRIRRHFAWAGTIPVAFITGELLSDQALRDFPEPFMLLRKSSLRKTCWRISAGSLLVNGRCFLISRRTGD